MPTFTSARTARPRAEFWICGSLLGPPLLWLLQFEVRYALAGATTAAAGIGRGLAGVVALAGIGACGVLAERYRRIADASPLDVFARKGPRIRFLATLAVMTSGLFFLLTLVQFLPAFFLRPGGS